MSHRAERPAPAGPTESSRLSRRCWMRAWLMAIAPFGGTSLTACATWPGSDRIVDLRNGQDTVLDRIWPRLADARFLLLGEQHDNADHHDRRAALLRQLSRRPDAAATHRQPIVVAEHLTRGLQAPAASEQPDLLAALESAGFDRRAWQWPLHQPLFAAARDAGWSVRGGNLPAEWARRIAREGEAALPAQLATLLAQAPLSAEAQARLDADLTAGHCGQLPATRLPLMRLAQRARDAAMAWALHDSKGRPAVLLAGNGHVRSDFGVPQLLKRLDPSAPCISVVFGEPDTRAEDVAADYLWITPAPPRDDPCAAFGRMRRPAAPTRDQAR